MRQHSFSNTPDFPPRPASVQEKPFSMEQTHAQFENFKKSLLFAGAKEITMRQVPKEVSSLGQYLVRRENPAALLHAIETQEPLTILPIDEATGVRYSNCAVWNSTGTVHGLDNALHEGQTDMNSVVAVVGFLETPQADVVALKEASETFAGLERQNVRSYKGSLAFEEIRFVRLRVPIEAVSEEDMNDDEKDLLDEAIEARMKGTPKATFLYRWYIFDRNIQ